MHKTTMMKRNLNKWTNSFMDKATAKLLKCMRESASDRELVKMYAKDLADIYHVCHTIKQGEYSFASEMHYDLDTDVREMFPDRIINGIDKICDALHELHTECI